MMKKTLLYISLMMVVLALGSCTRNHGDIGPWFGTWHVESITANGTLVSVNGDYFFQFQSKVLRVLLVTERDQLVESFGTWEENDSKMILSFPDPSVYYIEMPGLEAYNNFTVTNTSSREVTLTKTDAIGTTFAFHLKKQP